MGALALCLGFTSCDGYEEPNPPAQSNPQDAILVANGLSFAPGQDITGQTVSLEQYNNEGHDITVATVDFTDPFPADYNLKVVMEMAKTADFTNAREVETTVADGLVTVAPDAVQAAYVKIMGKSPDAKEVYFRFAAYAVNGSSQARIGDPDTYYGPFTMNVLPFPSEFVIEDGYYLLGTINGWSVAEALPFTHSSASVYDDPVFTIAIEITADQADAGWWWKVIPQSTYDNGDWMDTPNSSFGPEENGDDSLAGMLFGRTETADSQAGCIFEEGTFILTINMEEMSYEFSEAVPNLWTPGPANGWNFGNPMMLLGTTDYINYMGYVYVENEVKFTSAPDWGAKYNLGKGDEDGKLANGSNDNLSVSENGLYWIEVNLPDLTYNMTLINTIGVIGDATPNGWDASTALTPSDDFKTWSGDVTFGSGEFKFRCNDDWAVNLGGEYDQLTQGGANLPSPGAGTYTVTLDLSELPYTVSLVKK